jgi:plastocyanin
MYNIETTPQNPAGVFSHRMSQEKIMKRFIKTGRRAGVVVSLTAAALIAPEVILAGSGCMNNQNMARGYYPHSPMGPQAGYYRQRMPNAYNGGAAPYAGMMAAPYNRPMSPRQSSPVAVVAQAEQPIPTSASSDNGATFENITVRINGMRFEQASITIKPGTTVTWVHENPMPHTINGNVDGLGSSPLYNGQTYSHTF